MFGSDILEIAVGLVLVYLLLSLVMTSVQEALQQVMKTRAVVLRNSVKELLQNDTAAIRRFYDHPLIYALHKGTRTETADKAGEKLLSRYELPSYIPREVFSAVMIDLVEGVDKVASTHLEKAYAGLKKAAGDDVKQVRREVEKWYDGAMDRASGAYKRHAQLSLIILGLITSVALNVNSVTISRHLATDPQARELANQMAARIAREGLDRPAETTVAAPAGQAAPADVENASEAVAAETAIDNAAAGGDNASVPERASADEPASAAELKAKTDAAKKAWSDFDRQMEEIGLPVGWSEASVGKIRASFPDGGGGAWWGALATFILGYFVTALAISLGAPFWFDILNRIMVIRSTVKPREKSPDEPPVDGTRADKAGVGQTAR